MKAIEGSRFYLTIYRTQSCNQSRCHDRYDLLLLVLLASLGQTHGYPQHTRLPNNFANRCLPYWLDQLTVSANQIFQSIDCFGLRNVNFTAVLPTQRSPYRARRCSGAQAGSLASVQQLHVITYAFFQGKPWLIAERAARAREISLREVLIMRVRIIDVVRLKIGSQTFV